jgi:type IV secretion system protein TrbL
VTPTATLPEAPPPALGPFPAVLSALPNPCDLPGAGRICNAPGAAIAAGWEATVTSLVKGVSKIVKLLFTFWMSFPDPDVSSGNSQIAFLDTHLSWIVNAVAAGATLTAAILVILTRSTTHARTLGAVLLRVVAAGVFVGPLISGLLAAGDAYGRWIIDDAVGADFASKLYQLGDPTGMTVNNSGSTLMLLFALAGSTGSLVMIATLIFRTIVVTVLVGLLPLTAAASMSATGRQAWAKHTAWLLAFVLVKPAGATLLAVAFHWVQDGTTPQDGLLGGVCLLMMGLLLPVMLRLLVPATSAVAGRSGALAGIGALATGALALAPGGQAAAVGARAASGGRLIGRAGATAGAAHAGNAGSAAGAGSAGGAGRAASSGGRAAAGTAGAAATAGTAVGATAGTAAGAGSGSGATGGAPASGAGGPGTGRAPSGGGGTGGGARAAGSGAQRVRRVGDAATAADRFLAESTDSSEET